MKKMILITLSLFICFKGFAKQNLDDAIASICQDIISRCEQKEILAILDFTTQTEEMGSYINSQLISTLSENSSLRIVTRQHMDKIEEELKFQSSGLVSDSTVLSIGERLGAHSIVFGSLEELDNKYLLQIKMLDVSQGAYSLFKTYEITRSAKTEQLLHYASTIYKSSIGIIAEGNKNSISNIALAGGISFDYSLSRRLSLGTKVIVSYDVFEKENTILTIEPIGIIKWYVVSPSGEPSAGLFVEGVCGPELLFINSKLRTSLSAGLALGFRFTIDSFYIEPYLRGGYPYLFGTGINLGFRF